MSVQGALIGRGSVHHARLRPVRHAFTYPAYFLLLPLRRLRAAPEPALRRNRPGLLSFADRDHGDGRADCLDWIDEVLRREGVEGADGEVWLQCFPRVLGHTFKPVSFWFCERADGRLAAILVEVNNTFGERHCYLLDGPDVGWERELRAAKCFHVSPFCAVEGGYRFRFAWKPVHPQGGPARSLPSTMHAAIDHDDAAGPLLHTSLGGALQPLAWRSVAAAFFGVPLMTLGVVARIHWQALRLWRRRVPFFRKPPAPESFVSR